MGGGLPPDIPDNFLACMPCLSVFCLSPFTTTAFPSQARLALLKPRTYRQNNGLPGHERFLHKRLWPHICPRYVFFYSETIIWSKIHLPSLQYRNKHGENFFWTRRLFVLSKFNILKYININLFIAKENSYGKI